MCAGYLFQPDKQYDVTYDTGDKAIQCGRHVDIFKFWLMWKAKVCIGTPGSIAAGVFLRVTALISVDSTGNCGIRAAY